MMRLSRCLSRTYVITGGASGIGRAAATILRKDGHTVITVDVAKADVNADLSTDEGVKYMVSEVTKLSGGVVDAVMANAGLATNTVATFAVNYYGAIGTLEGLRPLLEKSPAPRAAATASIASLMGSCPKLIELALSGDKAGALKRAAELEVGIPNDPSPASLNYGSSKNALCRWIRRTAATDLWAGKGIALNAIAPGIIKTPMTAAMLADPATSTYLHASIPMPLNGYAEPEVCANTLKYLTSVENSHITGQIIFVDGGFEAIQRGKTSF